MNRSIDLVIACLILIPTAPFLLIIAIMLKIESGGPILSMMALCWDERTHVRHAAIPNYGGYARSPDAR